MTYLFICKQVINIYFFITLLNNMFNLAINLTQIKLLSSKNHPTKINFKCQTRQLTYRVEECHSRQLTYRVGVTKPVHIKIERSCNIEPKLSKILGTWMHCTKRFFCHLQVIIALEFIARAPSMSGWKYFKAYRLIYICKAGIEFD